MTGPAAPGSPALPEPPADRCAWLPEGLRSLVGAGLGKIGWEVMALLAPPDAGGSRPYFAAEGDAQYHLADAIGERIGYGRRAVEETFAELRALGAITTQRRIWDNRPHMVLWGNFLATAAHGPAPTAHRSAVDGAGLRRSRVDSHDPASSPARPIPASIAQPTVAQQLPLGLTPDLTSPEARTYVEEFRNYVPTFTEVRREGGGAKTATAGATTAAMLVRLLNHPGASTDVRTGYVRQLVERGEADQVPPMHQHLIGAALAPDPIPAPTPTMSPLPGRWAHVVASPPGDFVAPAPPRRPEPAAPPPASPPRAAQAAEPPKDPGGNVYQMVGRLAEATAADAAGERAAFAATRVIGPLQAAILADGAIGPLRADIHALAERLIRFIGDSEAMWNFHHRVARLVAAGLMPKAFLQKALENFRAGTARSPRSAYTGTIKKYLVSNGLEAAKNARPNRLKGPKREKSAPSDLARSLAGSFAAG